MLVSAELNNEEQWDKFIEEFNEYIEKQINSHISNHLLLLMGDDFLYYKFAEENFSILEEIMRRTQHKYPQYNFKFSTPSQYIDAIHSQDLTWPTKYDDYLQFTDNPG